MLLFSRPHNKEEYMERFGAYAFLERIASDTTSTVPELEQTLLILKNLDANLQELHPTLILEEHQLIGNKHFKSEARKKMYQLIEAGFRDEGSLDQKIKLARDSVHNLLNMFKARLDSVES